MQPGFGDRFPPCRARLGCRWISMDFWGESMRRMMMVMIMFNMTCWVEIFSSGWILSLFGVRICTMMLVDDDFLDMTRVCGCFIAI